MRDDLDYNLQSAIEHNNPGITVDEIKQIVVQIDGENEGAPWHWLVKLKDRKYAYITGGCDYTGWD